MAAERVEEVAAAEDLAERSASQVEEWAEDLAEPAAVAAQRGILDCQWQCN